MCTGERRARRRWRRACGVGVISLALLVPAGARGASVSVEDAHPVPGTDDEVRYVAAPGERNRVAVRVTPTVVGTARGLAWTFSDPGAVITPGNHCTALDEHTARCLPRPSPEFPTALRALYTARIDVGDLADEVSFSRQPPDTIGGLIVSGGPGPDRLSGTSHDPSRLYGEEGADRLSAGAGGGHLHGGPGDDRLTGGDGFDQLNGGGGTDRLSAGARDDFLSDGDADRARGSARPGPDLLDGGPGQDEVSYRTRSAAVRVDLARPASAGELGEGDRLSRIENVSGGRGSDRLAGDGDANRLAGGRGRDRLIGRNGNDTLDAGPGGGAITCGPGRDVLPTRATSPSALAADCERIYLPPFGPRLFPAYPQTANERRLEYTLHCPPNELDGEPFGTAPCSLRLRIHAAFGRRRLLAAASVSLGMWRGRTVAARLTTLGRRLAAGPRGVRATATLKMRIRLTDVTLTPVLRWIFHFGVPHQP